VLWLAWWSVSLRRDRLLYGDATWFPPLDFLLGDFRYNIDHVSRVRLSGQITICSLNPLTALGALLFASRCSRRPR
jgi:hypothetical protein